MTKPKAAFDLIGSIRSYFKLTPFQDIISWVEKYISYADDVSAERDRPDFTEYPYQVDIIKAWEDMDVRKHVTVVSCEQMRQDQYMASWASLPYGVRPLPKSRVLSFRWEMRGDQCHKDTAAHKTHSSA